MANNYSQFSEVISEITPDEANWIKHVLRLDVNDPMDLMQLQETLQAIQYVNLECWPQFEYKLEKDGEYQDLWLYSTETFDPDQLCAFVRVFIRKFRPECVFSVSAAMTCSKPRIGEFGGCWFVIYAGGVLSGNTWDDAKEAMNKLEEKPCPR